VYLDSYVCLNSLGRDSKELCRVLLGLVRKGKSIDYKYVSWVNNKKNQSFINNSRRIATLVLGFLG
jgi:hypothetical protein